MNNSFKDHFSVSVTGYAEYRPTYPMELVDYLAGVCPQQDLAWDCECGTGQLSVLLAQRFKQVIATDASSSMIEKAECRENIDYRCMRAENSDLPDGHVDLS